MSEIASQITCISIVCSTSCSDADQRKHQNSASLAFVRGIHRWPVDSPHKGPVAWKMFPFDDVMLPWKFPCCMHITLQLTVPIGRTACNIDGLVQRCGNSSVLAMVLLQSCTKPSLSDLNCVIYIRDQVAITFSKTHTPLPKHKRNTRMVLFYCQGKRERGSKKGQIPKYAIYQQLVMRLNSDIFRAFSYPHRPFP